MPRVNWLLVLGALVVASCATGQSLDQSDVEALDCRPDCEAWADRGLQTCRDDGNDEASCDAEHQRRLDQCKALALTDCTSQVLELFSEPEPPLCKADDLAQSHCEGDQIVGTCANGRRLTLTCDDTQCSGSKVALGCRLDADEHAYCECSDAPCKEGDTYCDGDTLMACSFAGRYLPTECSDDACIAAGYGLYDHCGDDGASGTPGCICGPSITPIGACSDTDPTRCLGSSNVAYCLQGGWVAASCVFYCGWLGFESKGCSAATDACDCDFEARLDDACDRGARAYCQCSADGCDETQAATVYSNCYRNNNDVRAAVQCVGSYAVSDAGATAADAPIDCEAAIAACLN
ncbi:MAG TPA: hypothetical protein VHM70_28615 [Polyangiaceae bacterium]|jgi:hypothetical protein|nr:hypothetical protein [Polyangiaceae bacterium]